MNVADLKDFEKMLKICRKSGVTEISVDNIAVKFGELPRDTDGASHTEGMPSDELTPEQLMYMAVNQP